MIVKIGSNQFAMKISLVNKITSLGDVIERIVSNRDLLTDSSIKILK